MPSPNVLIHDSADKTPPRPAGEPPHRIIRGSDFDRPQQPPLVAYLPWPAWVVLGVLSLALGAFLVWRVDQAIRQSIEALRASGPFGVFLIGFTPPAVLAILVYIVLRYIAARVHYSIMRHRYLAYQAGLTRTRLGVPVAADVAASTSWADVMTAEGQAIGMQVNIAPSQQFPLLSTKSDSSENGAPVTVYGAGEDAAPPPLSPDGGPMLEQLRKRYNRSSEHLFVGSVGETPIYLRWGNAGVSALIGGSGGGKTNTARLIAAWHALNGGGLAFCDGHGEVRDESLIDSCRALSGSYILPPAISDDDIYATVCRMDAIGRARINGTEPIDVPLLLVFDEFISVCRNHPKAGEIVNKLVNFGDEYRKVNMQALLTVHHGRGDVIDKQLGNVLRATIGTRIVHNTDMAEAKFWLKPIEAQGVDRLKPGEALFFDKRSDPQKITVPWLPPSALAEVQYPAHPGWPLSVETPQEQQRSDRQRGLDGVRRRAEKLSRPARIGLAHDMARQGFRQQEIQYACMISDEAAGQAWRAAQGRIDPL